MFFSLQEWIILLITVLGCLMVYFYHVNTYFKRHKLNYLKPLPLFGNMFSVVTSKKHTIDLLSEIYRKFPKDKYAGFFNFMTPYIIVKDIELIKKIGIKDFDHFVDHMEFTDEHLDPIVGKNLFALKGDKWREMRNTLSPAFTTAKMRGMLPFINEIGEKLVEHLNSKLKDNVSVEYNIKDLTSRFANDVIASCAFGIQVDSFNDKKNEFFLRSQSFSQLDFVQMLKSFAYFLAPGLVRLSGLKLTNSKLESYFTQLFISNINTREEKNIVRQDMVHLLMLAKKGALKAEKDDEDTYNVDNTSKTKKTKWTNTELTAQALIFIFAGFDTVSTALSFLLYELAVNPDIQDKLRSEIDAYMKENNDKIDYSNLNSLKYLDMVLSETLRLWPPGLFLDRVCVKPYKLPPTNDESNNSYTINTGEILWIPLYDIQRDPNYYENPNKFDPERFSDENKSSINMSTYMPFGVGPRLCIGSRFAIMEIKLFAVHFIYNFIIEPSANSTVPMKLKPHFFDLIPETGHHLGIKKRIIKA